ncbi:hypothetical protein J6590_051104 [Homalodisca vitripennis]|nr:hypothetical protein J6590_051104 [Homalodisca vitripennis]
MWLNIPRQCVNHRAGFTTVSHRDRDRRNPARFRNDRFSASLLEGVSKDADNGPGGQNVIHCSPEAVFVSV